MVRSAAATAVQLVTPGDLDEVLDIPVEEALAKGLLKTVPLDEVVTWLETGEPTPALEPVLQAMDEGKPCGTLS